MAVKSPDTVHVPPAVASENIAVVPVHKLPEPDIGVAVFTVTIVVLMQPAPDTNVIIAVPLDTPLTIPPVPTVAIVVALLLHVPVPAVNKTLVPVHIGEVLPVILAAAITFTVVVVIQPPVPNV